jgi:hypothetical protein
MEQQQQTPPTPTPNQAPSIANLMADRAKSASKDSLHAFKIFALDPVGGLATAYSSLGEKRALSAGIGFGVTFALSIFIAAYISHLRPEKFGEFLKFVGCAFVPFLGMAGASFVGRKAFRGDGTFAVDAFVSGASLLPFAFALLAASILGFANVEVIAILGVFAVTLNILMLFTGFTRISHISEKGATLIVPLVLLISVWFSKIIYASMISNAMSNSMYGQ